MSSITQDDSGKSMEDAKTADRGVTAPIASNYFALMWASYWK